jgi:alpha-beta hydrolase superfamily lysophospholipase
MSQKELWEMRHEIFILRTADGLSLSGNRWLPDHDPSTVLCIIHGLGEHIGRYEHIARYVTDRGYAVLAADMRGHGGSEGRRGHISSYEALMNDISLLVDEAASRYPDMPTFLYGQSMGGNLVINYALRRASPISGFIASSPLLRTATPPPRWKHLLGKHLRSLLPFLPLNNEVRAEDLSRDPEIVKAYKDDPLVHDRLTLRFYDVLLAGEWAMRNAHELRVPALIMHGDSDRVTSYEASREFSELAGDICTFKSWEGFYHEIHNEPDGKLAMNYMLEWLEYLISE